jgi:hypothetical protein
MTGPTIENRGLGALVQLRPPRRSNTHRVVVLCDSVADVVGAAGGWLFDRGMAGCHVNVLLTSYVDDRALRILGAQAIDLQTAVASEVSSEPPETLVVAANLFRRDARVRRRVLETIGDGMTRVMVWGDSRSTEFDGLVMPVEHRLSIAARAFKEAALAAAGVCPASAGGVEMFRGVDLRACRPEQSAS